MVKCRVSINAEKRMKTYKQIKKENLALNKNKFYNYWHVISCQNYILNIFEYSVSALIQFLRKKFFYLLIQLKEKR